MVLKILFSRLSSAIDDEVKDNRSNSTLRSNNTILTKEDSNWYEYGCV